MYQKYNELPLHRLIANRESGRLIQKVMIIRNLYHLPNKQVHDMERDKWEIIITIQKK